MPAATVARFAELVFAYIDELSASSVAGHADELATTGRVRQQRLERLAHHLVSGAPEDTVRAAAERADWSEPTRVIGPLYAMGAALSLASLWLNAIGAYIPEQGVPNWFRTVALVSIDFLVPGTVLGMIGPVVAKIAVEQARKAGSAIGSMPGIAPAPPTTLR